MLNLTLFIRTMSDHTKTNYAIIECLNNTHHTNLLDLKCHPYKSDLVKNSFHNEIKQSRKFYHVISDGADEIEIEDMGMKVPKGKKYIYLSSITLFIKTSLNPSI